MVVSLPPELADMVNKLVATGEYSSTEAVIHDALAQLQERFRKFDELKSSIQEGIKELDRGESVPFDVEEILAEGRRQFAQRHSSKRPVA